MTSPLRPTDPRQLGRYRMVSRLGEGGMGTVFLARDPDDRLVAVKVVRPEYSDDEHFRARFRSEVNRARQVPPFCTAEVLDADPDDETPYLVVEYVDGPSLHELVTEQGPLRGGSLHSVAVGVAAALAAIHGAGVIHRDLKPRNVLFALGSPKVIDFGIARALEPTSHHTRTQEVMGTLSYMAPERFDPETDRRLTPAADIFAWGVVVTYAGTGRTPFSGDSPTVTAARILTQPPVLHGLPEPLAGVVALALAKDPAERPTAHELLDLLLAAGPGEPGALTVLPDVRRAAEAAQHSGRYATGEPGRRTAKPGGIRRKLIAAAAGAIVVVGAAGLGLAQVGRGGDDHPTQARPSAAAVASSVPAAPVVRGPAIVDPLDREGQWSAIEDVTGRCGFDHGLVVTTTSAVRCGGGPEEVFPGAQTLGVSVKLDARSCAAIWFRVAGDNGYRVALCPSSLSLGLDVKEQGVTEVAAVARRTTTAATHRVTISTDGVRATVGVDDAPVLHGSLTEAALATGKVMLGAVAEHSGDRARVTFRDADVRSGGPAPAPSITSEDATFNARVHFFHVGFRSAVVQPADLLSGAEFCRRHRLESSSARCKVAAVLDAGDLKVTLPLAKSHQIREYRDGDPACVDAATRAGRCSTTSDRFSNWATEHSPFPARVVVRDGVVVEVDELDLP